MCNVHSCSSYTFRCFCEIPCLEGIPLGSVRWYCSLDTRKSEPMNLGLGDFSSGSYGSCWVIQTSFPCDLRHWRANWLIARYSLWPTAKQGFSQWKGWVASAGSEKLIQAQELCTLNGMHYQFWNWLTSIPHWVSSPQSLPQGWSDHAVKVQRSFFGYLHILFFLHRHYSSYHIIKH